MPRPLLLRSPVGFTCRIELLKACRVEECPCVKSLWVIADVAASIACLFLHCCILFLGIIIIIIAVTIIKNVTLQKTLQLVMQSGCHA